jgi:hypothetical protein
MKKALWFSRHTPTPVQTAEAVGMGFELVVLEEATKYASQSIQTDDDLLGVVAYLQYAELPDCPPDCPPSENIFSAVFGVFAAPVQNRLVETAEYVVRERIANGTTIDAIPCYSAWNVQRMVVGGKPTFEHKQFVFVGRI